MKRFQKVLALVLAVLFVVSVASFSTRAASTTITGDANGNGVANVIDLIHMKKTMLSNEGDFYDMDGDLAPSATDLVIMRQLLLDRFAVVYRANGLQHAIQFYRSDDAIVQPSNPYVRQMIFKGWDGLPSTAPANVLVVNGLFIPDFELPIIK